VTVAGPPEPAPIHLVVATDRAYLPWTATTILSALDRHETGELAVHLLHGGDVEDSDAQRMDALVTGGGATFCPHVVRDERIDALRPPQSGGRVTWFRLVVPDVLDGVDRAILLDADTFVCEPLHPLWTTALRAGPIAAVANVVEPAKQGRVRALGMADPRKYLNAGVLLLDLAQLRREDAASAMLRFASENAQRISWLDQDTLNVVFNGRWQPLHPRWNAMNSLWVWRSWANDVFGAEAVREATESPAVLHFEGPAMRKPWHYLNDHPWRDAYRSTLARTPWASTPIEDDTPAVHVIARLPRPWRIPAYWRLVKIRNRFGR
jgi:lipopolysaccharide biosynthesis glycosyltransferase